LKLPFSTSQPAPYLQSLLIDGPWQFRQAGTEQWYEASVPGNVYLDLHRNGLIPDPMRELNAPELSWVEAQDWEYQTSFVVKEKWLAYDQLELQLEGLDTYADIYLNGQLILSTDNMFHSWHTNVKSSIIPDDFELIFKEEERNELRIYFHSPVKKSLPLYKTQGYILPADPAEPPPRLSVYSRKAAYHFGTSLTPRILGCGILGQVQLCAWKNARIVQMYYTLNKREHKYASLTARFEVEAARAVHALFRIKSHDDGTASVMEPAMLKPGMNAVVLDFEILHPRLWWPNGMGKASRYRLIGEMTIDGRVVQTFEVQLGLRSIELVEDAQGAGDCLKINGQPAYLKGALWMPPQYFREQATAEDYERLLEAARAANINLLRLWAGGGYEREIFYELCDQKGIMVWHDLMFPAAMYPAGQDFLKRIEQEVVFQLKRLRNRACVALWCGNDQIEMQWESGAWQKEYAYSPSIERKVWADYEKIFYDLLPALISEHDPQRLYLPSYPQPRESRHAFVDIAGYPSFPSYACLQAYIEAKEETLISDAMKLHEVKYEGEAAHLRILQDLEAAFPRSFSRSREVLCYLSQVLQARKMKEEIEAARRQKPAHMGIIYRQLNDSWPATSESGIDYSGRWKALHYKLKDAFAPVLVSPVLQNGNVQVMVVSDLATGLEARLEISLKNFYGESQQSRTVDVSLEAGELKTVFEAKEEELLMGLSKDTHFLDLRLVQGPNRIGGNLFYFCPPVSLKLKKARLKRSYLRKGNTYYIELVSDSLMKSVYLHLQGSRGFFSDNFFDLLPNVEYVVTLSPAEESLNLGEELRIWSLADFMEA